MASGSNAPFSGEHNDLENVVDSQHHKKGMTDAEMETRLEMINDISESKFAAGLNIDSFEGLQFDSFVDESKISSSSNIRVKTGTNGFLELSGEFDVDDFEDGVDSGWSGDTGNLSAQTNFVLNGSQSGNFSSGNQDIEIAFTGINKSKDFQINLRADNQTGDGSDTIAIRLNTFSIGAIEFYGNGDINFYNGSYNNIGSWEANKTYKLRFKLDYSNNKAEIIINGESKGIFDFKSSVSKLADITVANRTDFSGESVNLYLDNIGTEIINLSTSGSIVSTTKNLSYTPSAVQVQQKADIPSSGDIEFIAKDSSGNTKRITQSDLGSDVPLSFADGNVSIKIEETGDGTDTPTLKEYGVEWVE